ncbi:HDOD domain-containing protein [Salinibius halmophilus]|uniref:HDOD domain-containing protein n=1 Tax=Salinibius halmophilus TaxID=1853216 RepID=UPI000E66262A|nr:HDOD domain-containing protein [Salinibius halmophilus]
MTADAIEKILQGIRIPPQPQVLVDLHMAQLDGDLTIDHMAELIANDVGLAGTVIKIANATLPRKNRLSSIQQAVTRIGIDMVFQIVNGLSIKGELSDEEITNLNQFWDTAHDCAIACSALAKETKMVDEGQAYALGLFHNCGMALMRSKFDDYFEITAKAYQADLARLIDLENHEYKTNHCVVGYYTAKAWNLPLLLCQVIADHHDIPRALATWQEDSPGRLLFLHLKAAEHLCRFYYTLGNATEDHEWAVLKDLVSSQLGIGEYDLEDIRARLIDHGSLTTISS